MKKNYNSKYVKFKSDFVEKKHILTCFEAIKKYKESL